MEVLINVNMCEGMVFGGTNAVAGVHVILKLNLTKELGIEDVNAFQNFLRML